MVYRRLHKFRMWWPGRHQLFYDKKFVSIQQQIFRTRNQIRGCRNCIPLLLSAVLAFAYFAPLSPSSIVRINVDNQNVVAWLRKSRCSNKLGYRLLAVIELLKLKYNLKVSVSYIKSSANTSADMLSRGKIPRWLKTRGTRHNVPLNKFEEMIVNPIAFWKKALAI